MTKVALLDYGMGNLHSAAKALEKVGATVHLTSDPATIQSCDRVVFPGVGAMRDCMAGMAEAGVDVAVKQAVFNKPVMAICVGMQALFDYSEENAHTSCLGVLGGSVTRFDPSLIDEQGAPIKVPHMGWNALKLYQPEHPLWSGVDQGERFYFVHSYYVKPADPSLVSASCTHGVEFCASVIKDNLFATQFHPEKSSVAGLQLLKNFVEWGI